MAELVRPDFSEYVVHFTKDSEPIGGAEIEGVGDLSSMSAKGRLFSILSTRRLAATTMPWTNRHAVAFTECTWASLLDHARRYSKYGIGFSKRFLFSRGGGPAIYMTPELFERQRQHVPKGVYPFEPRLYAFITPFCPAYASARYRDRYWQKKKIVDYSHEREWRLPVDLKFSLSNVSFIIVASYTDMAQAPKQLKDGIGRDRWLLMDNYERIEEFWPVHRVPSS